MPVWKTRKWNKAYEYSYHEKRNDDLLQKVGRRSVLGFQLLEFFGPIAKETDGCVDAGGIVRPGRSVRAHGARVHIPNKEAPVAACRCTR
jgi:hypothetical protein